MSYEVEKILITEQAIAGRVAAMGRQISADFEGQEILCIGLLRGAFLFMADLVRHLSLPVEVEFIRCSSYGKATKSSGEVEIEFARKPATIAGRHILLVDDILDAGHTLHAVKEQLLARGAASVRTAAFLDKPSRRQVPFQADYRGFEIEDRFVVGYGMDFEERFRNLPYVALLRGV